MHEADEPDALVGLFDADVLAGEDLAEIDLLPVEQMRPQVVTALSWKGSRVLKAFAIYPAIKSAC